MQSRQYSQRKNTQKQTSAFSIPPAQGMFESRPFVVQQQTTEKSQLPDLKTSLMQAKRYGHHLGQIQAASVSEPIAAQPKMGKPIKSDAVNKPQVLQPARLNSVFAGQAMNSTLSSQPIQLVHGKEERQNAKKFNEEKKKELEKIKHAEKEPTDYKGFKKKGKGKNNNPVTDKFAKDHVVPAGNSMSNASSSVAHKRTWGGGRTSGRSTLVGMSKQDVKDEQRYAIEGRKMNETDFNGTGSIAPRMGVNKETKFAYENQTSTVTSDKHGNRKVAKGKKELGHPVLGMRGDQIHHLHGIQDIEDN